jgi:hypothetical protein
VVTVAIVIGLLLVSNIVSFAIGLLGRRELRIYRSSQRRGETLDFTRPRIGA